ncbi:hypothetical protein ACQUW5_14185 [Legionella sp. CNM-1927-20]|uniref:hypothetical protein n=1 Tax=Legionella sp. CNM-1927-20 TaxID=3422221 RepID=UPI00403A7CCD
MQNPKLLTNQNYIENIKLQDQLDLKAVSNVFSFVFNSLPDRVIVYPTENYYYFSFYHNGVEFSGNIRLDALDRDKGIVHFAYFSTFNRWTDELVNQYKPFTARDGVEVVKLGPLEYKISYGKKSVIFELNDLSKVRPPANKIRPDEEYIGPVYDESGIQFYLVYNSKIKRFHYVLNESETVPDTFTHSKENKGILIGTRTGFSFYRDDHQNRLILIGVYAGNSMVNNYFDGPFDQLPDNFIRGDHLREAFIDQNPELKGKIDRYGNTDNGSSRVVITPYIHYLYESQLYAYSDCTKKAKDLNAYYTCFDNLEDENSKSEDN